MDIWRWIMDYSRELLDTGDIRLAQLLVQLPEATSDDRHAEVDAIMPEALALARARDNPWAEVYVRHWYMQSKILHRHEVKDTLSEAVALLEFANRPETRGCPQSVCVTQDLACAYAEIDGPGYAAERLSVAAETLSRIDPTWPCFDCISGEYASALIDDGRLADTAEFIEAQRRALAEHHILELGGNLCRHRALVLLEEGHHEAAIEQLDSWDADMEGGYRAHTKRTLMARCLARLGRRDAAVATLPGADEVLPTPGLYEMWIAAVREFVDADLIPNDWRLGRALCQMCRRFADNGALYPSAWSALRAAEIAHLRGATSVARRLLQQTRDTLPALRRPELLRGDIEALQRALANTPASRPADRDVSLISAFERALDSGDIAALKAVYRGLGDGLDNDLGGVDPERRLALLEAGFERVERLMQDDEMLAQYCDILQELGWPDEAEAHLRARIEREPSRELLELLGTNLIECGRAEDLLSLLDDLDDRLDGRHPTGVGARWLRVHALRALGADERCRNVLRGLLADAADDPDDPLGFVVAARALAQLELRRGAYEEALEWLEQLLARAREPGPYDWDRMLAATLLERWDIVRDSATRLGMDIPGTGVIDVHGGLCRVRVRDDRGREAVYMASRISPLTARILEITAANRPGERERYHDVVVFEPAAIESAAAAANANDDDEHRISLYAVIATLQTGDHASFILDGVYPGDPAWRALVNAIEDLGGAILEYSDESYQLSDAPSDASTGIPPDTADAAALLPGMYAGVAVPAAISARRVHELLCEHAAGWQRPMVWLELARLLDDPDEVQRQLELAERYQL